MVISGKKGRRCTQKSATPRGERAPPRNGMINMLRSSGATDGSPPYVVRLVNGHETAVYQVGRGRRHRHRARGGQSAAARAGLLWRHSR